MSSILPPHRRSRRSTLAPVLAALLLAGAAVPALASGTNLPALAGAQTVADADLAEMHGKFVRPDAITFFGITMLSSWQDENGITTLAKLVFNVDFLQGEDGQPVPQLMIAWSREGDPAMDVTDAHEGYVPLLAAGQVLPLGGLGNFNGAAQVNAIAGADNRALNGMQIAIVPASALPSLADSGLEPIGETTNVTFADGDELQFRLVDNQVGIVMTGNQGLDSSAQLVGGDIGQLLQQTVLNSNHNTIGNNASVVFGIDALQNLDVVRAQEALSAMKGHGF